MTLSFYPSLFTGGQSSVATDLNNTRKKSMHPSRTHNQQTKRFTATTFTPQETATHFPSSFLLLLTPQSPYSTAHFCRFSPFHRINAVSPFKLNLENQETTRQRVDMEDDTDILRGYANVENIQKHVHRHSYYYHHRTATTHFPHLSLLTPPQNPTPKTLFAVSPFHVYRFS